MRADKHQCPILIPSRRGSRAERAWSARRQLNLSCVCGYSHSRVIYQRQGDVVVQNEYSKCLARGQSMDEDDFFFGLHYMVDAYDAPRQALDDVAALKQALADIPRRLGMHAISEATVIKVGPNNKKDPGGLSGFVLIAESHISFHTFPARGFVTIDVYTCKDELDTVGLERELKRVFKFKEIETHLVKRGRRYPQDDSLTG